MGIDATDRRTGSDRGGEFPEWRGNIQAFVAAI
jgi:hypothetical protein